MTESTFKNDWNACFCYFQRKSLIVLNLEVPFVSFTIGEVWAHKISIPPTTDIDVHIPNPGQWAVVHRFCLLLWCFYWILEVFRQCGILVFHCSMLFEICKIAFGTMKHLFTGYLDKFIIPLKVEYFLRFESRNSWCLGGARTTFSSPGVHEVTPLLAGFVLLKLLFSVECFVNHCVFVFVAIVLSILPTNQWPNMEVFTLATMTLLTVS